MLLRRRKNYIGKLDHANIEFQLTQSYLLYNSFVNVDGRIIFVRRRKYIFIEITSCVWIPTGISFCDVNVNLLAVRDKTPSPGLFVDSCLWASLCDGLCDSCLQERSPESPVVKFVRSDKADTHINITLD